MPTPGGEGGILWWHPVVAFLGEASGRDKGLSDKPWGRARPSVERSRPQASILLSDEPFSLDALMFGPSGFLVGAPQTLGRKTWGTRPPDPLGFPALGPPQPPQQAERGRPRRAIIPKVAEGIAAISSATLAAAAPLRRSGRFPPEPHPPQRQGDRSMGCGGCKAINPGGWGAKPPSLRPSLRRRGTAPNVHSPPVVTTHTEV